MSTPPRISQRMHSPRIIESNSQIAHSVKKYGLTMLVSSDDQVKAYIKKIMTQLNEWMIGGKISKLVVVITSKDTGEHLERWQFDVRLSNVFQDVNLTESLSSRSKYSQNPPPRNPPPSAPSTKRTMSRRPAPRRLRPPKRRKPRSRQRSSPYSGRSRRR